MTRQAMRALDSVKRARRNSETSTLERALHALAVDPEYIDAFVGDLTEEFALRAEFDGAVVARAWYVREVVRSSPHVIASALRRGGPRARTRVAAILFALLLTLTVSVVAIVFRDGPPVRIVPDLVNVSDGIVLNTTHPVQLHMRVFDRRGHKLEAEGVRFRWSSGAPLTVSHEGLVSCTQPGNTIVRASRGAATTDLDVRCRPIKELRASTWVDLIAGDAARDLPFVALGTDDRPVMQLRGSARVLDSAVATLEGSKIRPRAVGQTSVVIDVGDRKTTMQVIVHERVASFEGLRADQRFVAVPVHLAQGDTAHWALPRGTYWLKYLPRRAGEAPPTISLTGDANCSDGDGIRVYRLPLEEFGKYCSVRGPATVDVAHGVKGALVVEGSLALERVEFR